MWTHVNSDKIIGFEDWGTRRTSRFADHALVFMLRGLYSGWKMPISYDYCEGQTKTPQLIQCIKNIVKALKKTGHYKLLPLYATKDHRMLLPSKPYRQAHGRKN
ncbi:uncharacterized protein LOC143210733 [Lasioglossum baleicum]|uniref:uncharacterized protein LOC143210733 n=1 Tax=Lasioglossum baleicum TaxID=434251 RepID=UPI003FCC2DC8